MCGIVGHIGEGNTQPDLTYLQHRGPDASSTWSNGHNCTLGHVRLSILDLDERANQPMQDESSRYQIVFNGEIYNYIELRQKYLQNEPMKTSSDTEVLLKLWIKFGVDTIPKLRGMFSFAIWDNVKQKLWLVRDRFGQKPLNYYETSNGISFSSELNILRKDMRNNFDISHTAVGMFLRYQFIPAPYTIYEGVKKLLPAHYLVWENGKSKIEKYWDLSFDKNNYLDISEHEALEMLEQKVSEAIKIRLRSDVPVGSLLSGGVDSSLVTSIASSQLEGSFNTFSIGFSNQKYNELDYARAVAKKYNTNHHEFTLEEDEALGFLDLSISQYGEPFGDKSSLPSLLVSKIASEKIKVVLNGDGGDELMAGYPKYQLNILHRLLSNHNTQKYYLGKKINKLRSSVGSNTIDNLLMRLNYSALNPYYRIIDFREFYDDKYMNDLWSEKFNASRFFNDESQYQKSLLSSVHSSYSSLNQLLKIDYQHYFSNDLLVKMDIASMAYGLEARSPLMDHELMEFAAKLPTSYKIKDGHGKYLIKKLAEKYIPNELIYRKKMGFAIPVNEWMKGRFGEELMDLTNDPNNIAWQYVDRHYLKKLYSEHIGNKKDHAQRLWLALILSKWFHWSSNFE
ncbi:MAG: asparagine synthase (glutamine-hydrolyzing) [Balneola sp.]